MLEPAGEGLDTEYRHAATMSRGVKGEIQGFKCYVLLDEKASLRLRISIASGLQITQVSARSTVTYVTISKLTMKRANLMNV